VRRGRDDYDAGDNNSCGSGDPACPGSALLISRRSRTRRREEQRERTREEFGEEYERTARERGSEEEAEKELRRRRGRVERQVSPLSDESRQLYEERMREVEMIFVDNPERAVEMADRTVSDILVERNFVADPSQDDRETEEGLAVMYPEVAGDYREARRARADVVARSARGLNPTRDQTKRPQRTCGRSFASTAPSTRGSRGISAW
jgi:hypothetical protein